MDRAFAKEFYGSRAWKKCREAYKASKSGLCERCLAKGLINPGSADNPLQVHHKVHLTPETVKDPTVALNWDNLELLCRECHAAEHEGGWIAGKNSKKRYKVDALGHVTLRG